LNLTITILNDNVKFMNTFVYISALYRLYTVLDHWDFHCSYLEIHLKGLSMLPSIYCIYRQYTVSNVYCVFKHLSFLFYWFHCNPYPFYQLSNSFHAH